MNPFLQAIKSGDTEVAKEIFKASMQDKVFAELDNVRDVMQSTFMQTSEPVNIETEVDFPDTGAESSEPQQDNTPTE